MTFNILSFSLFHTQLGVVHKINIPSVNYIRSTVHYIIVQSVKNIKNFDANY